MDDILETLYEKISGSDSVNDRLSLITAKKDLTHLIDKKCNEARIKEAETIIEAYQTRPGKYWDGVVFLAGSYLKDRLAELTKGGNNE